MAKFKTRARTIDMLGRQQIAGIPTAISELFKNAHDAYADRVEVDFFRSDGLFVLRDDGIGMTAEDFERRWLTIGTESKLNAGRGLEPPPRDPSKSPRPVLGEKGIGRLAIAAIGPQVLVLTRAKREDRLHDIVAAFIHWGIFESPGIDLDQIEIPVLTYGAGMLPARAEVRQLVDAFQGTIHGLAEQIDQKHLRRLEQDLARFDVDPAEAATYLPGPSLAGDGCGTHFYILPASESLALDIDSRKGDDASPLMKTLIGFTNTMTPDHSPPAIETAFRDHRTNENDYVDLIGEDQFFTPDEFKNADHHFRGEFDEFGQFSGTVSVYGEEHSHVVPWMDGGGTRTTCGPFQIDIAYIPGKAIESTLPTQEHARLRAKLDQIGGLYIYRDGIRILPYGNTDYDFLEIEKRRTLSAYYYYFSYRRMFGVVQLTRAKNAALSEKAGREGFRENKAYKQFRAILQNFFLQIAADFFRDEGAFSNRYTEFKAELTRAEMVRREREKLTSSRKKAFSSSLNNFFKRTEAAQPERDTEELLNSILQNVEEVVNITDPHQRAVAVLELESDARKQLDSLRKTYTVSRPRGVGLPRVLVRDYEAYEREATRIEETIFSPAAQMIASTIDTAVQQAHISLSRRARIEAGLTETIKESRRELRAGIKTATEVMTRVTEDIRTLLRSGFQEWETLVTQTLTDFARTETEELSEADAHALQQHLEQEVQDGAAKLLERVQHVTDQLAGVVTKSDTQAFDTVTTLAALEEELVALREQADTDLELVELGRATEAISHEFAEHIRTVRASLRRLESWADRNASLKSIYRDLRASFDHLDNYVALLTPLQRRGTPEKIEISGAEIRDYLDDLFRERLHDENISLESTTDFENRKIFGLLSTFYPAFINLVDNAIFWLSRQPEPRRIILDAEGDSLLVTDTGPGVTARDREAIFERGFSRKPGGRGMGLRISRDALAKEDYELMLDPPRPGFGAIFRISPAIRSNSTSTPYVP